jgi:hypothetical protein
MSALADRGILMDCLIIDLNGLCADPIAISQSGGQLSSGKRASCCVIFSLSVQSHRGPCCGFAASILRLWRGPSLRACILRDIYNWRRYTICAPSPLQQSRGTVQLKAQGPSRSHAWPAIRTKTHQEGPGSVDCKNSSNESDASVKGLD